MVLICSVLDQKNPFLVNQKNQNCHFKLKFGTKADLNKWNSMMMFTFSVFDKGISFFCRFGPKIQNCLFKVKCDTKANPNMQN